MFFSTATAVQQPESIQTFNRAYVTKSLVNSLKPWIQPTDLNEFIDRLDLSEESKMIAKKRCDQYLEQGNVLRQTAADKLCDTGFLKLVDTKGELLEFFDFKEAMEINLRLKRCIRQVTQELIRYRDEFLEDLHERITVDDHTWQNAVLWVRRQQFLSGAGEDTSWQDLMCFPDLIDQYEQLLEEKEFLLLVNPESDSVLEIAEAVHTCLNNWALKTDMFVDRYYLQASRWRFNGQVAELSSNRDDWISVWRVYRKNEQQRYVLFLSTSNEVASLIEPVVGPWATERWNRTTELRIFPESCPQNSFEQHFSSLITKGTLSEEDLGKIKQLILPNLQTISKLRVSFSKAAFWSSDYLIPKLKGYETPSYPINWDNVQEKYLKEISTILDILDDTLSNDDSITLNLAVSQSLVKNMYTDYPTPTARMLYLSLNDFDNN